MPEVIPVAKKISKTITNVIDEKHTPSSRQGSFRNVEHVTEDQIIKKKSSILGNITTSEIARFYSSVDDKVKKDKMKTHAYHLQSKRVIDMELDRHKEMLKFI